MDTVPNRTDHQTTIVDQAVSVLRTLNPNLNRQQAGDLLDMWARRSELTPGDRAKVLDAFGPAPTAGPARGGAR